MFYLPHAYIYHSLLFAVLSGTKKGKAVSSIDHSTSDIFYFVYLSDKSNFHEISHDVSKNILKYFDRFMAQHLVLSSVMSFYIFILPRIFLNQTVLSMHTYSKFSYSLCIFQLLSLYQIILLTNRNHTKYWYYTETNFSQGMIEPVIVVLRPTFWSYVSGTACNF